VKNVSGPTSWCHWMSQMVPAKMSSSLASSPRPPAANSGSSRRTAACAAGDGRVEADDVVIADLLRVVWPWVAASGP
jgi:hypothetical protein